MSEENVTPKPTTKKSPRACACSAKLALRRQMILGCLRAHPTLREGMAAAGVRFAQLRGTASRVPDFGAALKEIMAVHRAARKARHKPENRAAVRAMVSAGVPSDIARTALRRLHGDRRGPCSDPVVIGAGPAADPVVIGAGPAAAAR